MPIATEATPGADKFISIVKDIRTCMFVTHTAEGTLAGRPMTVQETEADGTVWFLSFADVPKVDEIKANDRVQLTYVDGDTWVSAHGQATIVDDVAKKEQLWNPFAQAWFQCEASDPKVALIRVDVEGGESWDSPSKPAQLLGVVKALVTKTEPAEGDNRTFTM